MYIALFEDRLQGILPTTASETWCWVLPQAVAWLTCSSPSFPRKKLQLGIFPPHQLTCSLLLTATLSLVSLVAYNVATQPEAVGGLSWRPLWAGWSRSSFGCFDLGRREEATTSQHHHHPRASTTTTTSHPNITLSPTTIILPPLLSSDDPHF